MTERIESEDGVKIIRLPNLVSIISQGYMGLVFARTSNQDKEKMEVPFIFSTYIAREGSTRTGIKTIEDFKKKTELHIELHDRSYGFDGGSSNPYIDVPDFKKTYIDHPLGLSKVLIYDPELTHPSHKKNEEFKKNRNALTYSTHGIVSRHMSTIQPTGELDNSQALNPSENEIFVEEVMNLMNTHGVGGNGVNYLR